MSQQQGPGWGARAGFAAVVMASFATASVADILIVSSSAPTLKPGMQLADSAMLEIPAGAKVRVLLPSGATLAIAGPASRAVKDVTKGEPLAESVWAKAKEVLETGGVDQSRPGATRGVGGQGAPSEPRLSWNEIAASANGAVCVERGAQLVILRTAGSRSNDLTVIDTSGNSRARLVWKDGELAAQWPAELTPRADTVYQLMATGQPMRQLRLKLIDKADAQDDRALRTLLENDCRQQVRDWVQSGAGVQ